MTTIKIDTRELDRISEKLDTSARKVLTALAFQVEGEAKQLSPVDTGAMRASIFTEVFSRGENVARIGPTVEYAPYVELGTSKMAAQPFLFPALESVVGKFNSGATWRELCE
jgi:HK97 gp10 family phage protein